jgi:hypothetical protein
MMSIADNDPRVNRKGNWGLTKSSVYAINSTGGEKGWREKVITRIILLGLWTLGLVLWLGNESATDPGLVAEIPKGIFLLSPLILLAFLPGVRETLERMGFHDWYATETSASGLPGPEVFYFLTKSPHLVYRTQGGEKGILCMPTLQRSKRVVREARVDWSGGTPRVTLPRLFGFEPGEYVRITLGDNPCLVVEKTEDFGGSGILKRLDDQRRITLGRELRRPAGLLRSKRVLVVEARDHIELWSPQRWKQQTSPWGTFFLFFP